MIANSCEFLQQFDDDPGPSSSQKGSVYDGCSRPIATATSTIENLQTQYKLKEGKLFGFYFVRLRRRRLSVR